MYLKRLEMLGFKSFAARTLLEFSTGITAVIGPNGAGKSNVADAVRWVLGEQSMRQLRGKKSDDIIFSGGYGKAALGMAEVSLTIDNSTGWVPSEYSELTVTRRSFRSGENEYLINKQKVRLKDVVLLLAQARIGHDSYTVVGQGLIDAALSLRAEERRGLFEDAAGIRPFQVQRIEAESRLRQTGQNLDRLRDIVSEIEPRLTYLAEQAGRAIEFGQLHSELQQTLLTWYTLQWQYLSAIRERVEATEQKQAQQISQSEQDLRCADEQREGLRVTQQSLQARSIAARTAHTQASEHTQKTERDLAVSQERITGLEHQRSEQQQQQQRLRERLLTVQQQIVAGEEQCGLAGEAVNIHTAALVRLEAQVVTAQKDFELDERRLRTMQSELIQVGARLGASQTDLGRQQKHLGERNRTLATRRESMALSQQLLRTLQTRQVEERASLATVRSEEQQMLQRKQALVRTISDAQQEIERLKATLAEAERQHRSISDRLNMLKNWRQSLSGYSDAVRALLRAPAGKLTGLVGPVPQLGVAPAGLEIALEAALGPNLQAVAVQTPADAYNCLHYLQTVEAGKAIVVWLEADSGQEEVTAVRNALPQEAALKHFLEVQYGRLQRSPEAILASLPHPAPSLPPQDQVLGLAWRHVDCEQRYLPLFQKMLQGIVLVKDLATAQALLASLVSHASDIHLQALVTLSGEVLYIDGWLIGGSSKHGPQQGLLAYERELRELPQQLHDQKALMDQLNGKIYNLQQSQQTRRIEQTTLDKELQKLASRLSGLNKAIDSTQRERMRLETEVQLAASIAQQLTAEIAGLEQEVQAAQERVQAHEKSQREMAGLLEQVEQEVAQRAIAYRRQQDELGQTRTTLAVKRQEATSLRQQLQALSTQAQELNAQQEQQAARMTETAQQEQALLEAVIRHRTELEQAQVRTRTFAEELHVVEGEVREIDQQMLALEQLTLQMRHTLSELEVAYRRCLLESQKARDAIDALLEQLHEEMGIASDLVGNSEALEPAEEGQLRRLRREADSLRNRLKTLGGCDPDAPQQYEETRTRFEFLTSQIADMQQAALHLYTIIEQLDVTMAKQFDITFQAVNARFREHFTTLFHGGNARLELITPKHAEDDTMPPTTVEVPLVGTRPYTASNMPAGVEVIVQPPGKKVQDLSLLSGGERALVSAALLFALLEINPPPFCLLDEVDAALDESNVTRFCDILKQLAQRTQFIVITHNQSTMAASQVIYGVSMSKDSASRLLSLKLEEATK